MRIHYKLICIMTSVTRALVRKHNITLTHLLYSIQHTYQRFIANNTSQAQYSGRTLNNMYSYTEGYSYTQNINNNKIKQKYVQISDHKHIVSTIITNTTIKRIQLLRNIKLRREVKLLLIFKNPHKILISIKLQVDKLYITRTVSKDDHKQINYGVTFHSTN